MAELTRPGFAAALACGLCLGPAGGATAQSAFGHGSDVPGKLLFVGAAGQALISRTPGLAVAGILALEWTHVVISAEVTFGETFTKWDAFSAGAQAGAVLLGAANSPYVLAGVHTGLFVDVIGEHRGRNDVALTAEAGYVFRQPERGRQIWIGARGLIPTSSHVYNDTAPQLPLVIVMIKLLI